MRLRRMAGAGIAAAAVLSLAACGGGGGDSTGSGDSGGQKDGGTTSSSMKETTKSSMAKAGVTTADDVYGPACDKVPKSGPGSVGAMIDEPVAKAASNNPLLDKLTKAIKAADLASTLNNADGITVFAPYDKAFEELGQETLQTLLTEKTDKLASILKFHVVPKRYDATGLAEAGKVQTLNKDAGKINIEGQGTDITINGAKVLCGNIPTANATVFVINEVLMPKSKN